MLVWFWKIEDFGSLIVINYYRSGRSGRRVCRIAIIPANNLVDYLCVRILKLEALRERRPPWPRQIITPLLPTVKMLSLNSERLLPPKNKK